MRSRSKREFQAAGRVINAVPRFHIIRVYMGEPPDTAADDSLEIFTMLIEQNEVFLQEDVKKSLMDDLLRSNVRVRSEYRRQRAGYWVEHSEK